MSLNARCVREKLFCRVEGAAPNHNNTLLANLSSATTKNGRLPRGVEFNILIKLTKRVEHKVKLKLRYRAIHHLYKFGARKL